jgi:iron complex transport system substrate-binding protein
MTLRLIGGLLLLALCAPAPPRRIVSTSPSITETLFALGLGPRVVGVSEYCRFPEEVMRLPKVGTFLRPNAELIARLQPDLVILQKLSNDLTDRLSGLGIRYLEVERGSLPSLYAMMEKIGMATSVGPRARELISMTQARLAVLRERSATLPKPKVLFIVGRRLGTLSNLVAVGSDSYLNELLRVAGATNVLDDPSMPAYPRISMETVIRLDPDILIDVAEPMAGSAEQQPRQKDVAILWGQQSELTAVRSKRVYALDSEAFVVPGPRVAEVAQSLFSIFHTRASR